MKKLYRINGLDLENKLTSKGYSKLYIQRTLWKYDYFFTKILFKKIFGKKERNWVRIDSKEMISKLKKVKYNKKTEYLYLKIRHDLKELGIIRFYNELYHVDGEIRENAFYKISDEALERGWKQVTYEITHEMEKNMNYMEYKGIYSNIHHSLSLIGFDVQSARNYALYCLVNKIELAPKKKGWIYKNRVMSQEVYSIWNTIIDKIEEGRFDLKIDSLKTGRIFHFLTNLPKQLRQFVTINGKKVVELDLSNSQPLLFVIKLLEWAELNQKRDADDIKDYLDLCQAGKFYEYIADLILSTGEEVDENIFKSEFFGKIFFSSETKNYRWRQIFEERFLNVSAAITHYKKEDYKQLSSDLCNVESKLFIHTISKRLYDLGFHEFFTIHDALFCTVDFVDIAYNIIKESCHDFGLNPNIKVKPIEHDIDLSIVRGMGYCKVDYLKSLYQAQQIKKKKELQLEKEKFKHEFNSNEIHQELGFEIL